MPSENVSNWSPSMQSNQDGEQAMPNQSIDELVEQMEADAETLTILATVIAEISEAEGEIDDSVTKLRLARAKSAIRELYLAVQEESVRSHG